MEEPLTPPQSSRVPNTAGPGRLARLMSPRRTGAPAGAVTVAQDSQDQQPQQRTKKSKTWSSKLARWVMRSLGQQKPKAVATAA